jgi:hypothetical protein
MVILSPYKDVFFCSTFVLQEGKIDNPVNKDKIITVAIG